MESLFGPVPINPVNNQPSNINENWARFNIISDINFDSKHSSRLGYFI